MWFMTLSLISSRSRRFAAAHPAASSGHAPLRAGVPDSRTLRSCWIWLQDDAQRSRRLVAGHPERLGCIFDREAVRDQRVDQVGGRCQQVGGVVEIATAL